MKPEPVPTLIQCKACGLPWENHKTNRGKVTLAECVRLLKAELASRPNISWTSQSLPTTATVTGISSGRAKAG